MGPEKIRFKREVNCRKVCKELIARVEPRGCTSEPGDKNYKQLQRSCMCICSRALRDHGNNAAWFVVLNNPSCDISMFLNHFIQEFLTGDENIDQLRLLQETVSALLKSMETEYDRSILRAISALLHARSETVNLGIDPTQARRKIKEVIEVAQECRMSIAAGEDIVNLRLKDRLKRIDAEIEEKKTVLEKKRETWLLKRFRRFRRVPMLFRR